MRNYFRVILVSLVNIMIFSTVDWVRQQVYDYPLRAVDWTTGNEVKIIIKYQEPYEKIVVCSDQRSISYNASIFRVFNSKNLELATADASITIYQDDRPVNTIALDSEQTIMMYSGSLKFKEMNKLQYLLLQGAELLGSGDNYSIVYDESNDCSYYFVYPAGNAEAENIQLLAIFSRQQTLEKPRKISHDLWEIIVHNYPNDTSSTVHWYYRESENQLSPAFDSPQVLKDDKLLLCSFDEVNGPKVLLTSMFTDQSFFYQELIGDFSASQGNNFLLAADLTLDDKLQLEYIGSDGKNHSVIYNIAWR